MDILWVSPFTLTHNKVAEYDVVLCLESGFLAIGLVGAAQESSLVCDVYRRALSGRKKDNYQSYGTDLLYQHSRSVSRKVMRRARQQPGIAALGAFRDGYPGLEITTISDQTVYPYDWRNIAKIFHRRRPLPPASVGVHWFGGSDIVRPYIDSMNPDTWEQKNNTFTDCLKRIGCPLSKNEGV